MRGILKNSPSCSNDSWLSALTTIWAASSEAFFAKAALPSLVLLLLSAIAVLVMLRREGHAS